MLTIAWVGCGLLAYHAGNFIVRNAEGHHAKLRKKGHKLTHRNQWKTCALDTALAAACCIMFCAVGSLSDSVTLSTDSRHRANKPQRAGDHKIEQWRLKNEAEQ